MAPVWRFDDRPTLPPSFAERHTQTPMGKITSPD
jgi:hypothetical protein